MSFKLTQRQERFAVLVVELESATAAYEQAYPRSQHWKRKSVHEEASRLLATPKIATRVQALRNARQAEFAAEVRRQGIQPADVIREQGHVGFFDPAALFGDDGQPLSIDRLSESTRRGLRNYKVRRDREGRIVRFEYVAGDKLKALRDLGEHLGMFKVTHAHGEWSERLRNMTEEELIAEQSRVESELNHVLAERDKERPH